MTEHIAEALLARRREARERRLAAIAAMRWTFDVWDELELAGVDSDSVGDDEVHGLIQARLRGATPKVAAADLVEVRRLAAGLDDEGGSRRQAEADAHNAADRMEDAEA